MDVLVLLEDAAPSPLGAGLAGGVAGAPLAHVHSVPRGPAPIGPDMREVVTLYDAPDAAALALALAAAVEGQRAVAAPAGAMRHLGVWRDGGAHGDAAWRDRATGQLVTQDLDIAAATLDATARRLLGECGTAIRQVVAGLATPDWPEGARRALQVTLVAQEVLAPAGAEGEGWLELVREADGWDDGD